jgi:tRNA (mo5U34)-methyltransferase
MRLTAPAGFNAAEFSRGFFCFQEWEIFPGHVIPGIKNVRENMERLGIPRDLKGLRVLDIAPWNGFFGFECLRRGAAELVSLGPDDPEVTGYNRTRDLLEIQDCRYFRGSVYDLSPEVHGHFDVVLFLGVIYHLRYPLLALDRIFDVARNRLFVDSPVIDRKVFDQTIGDLQRRKILWGGKATNQLPMVYFTKGAETGDPYNWFIPNRRALVDFVESAGFTIDSYADDGDSWGSVAATKATRAFKQGLEGWNEGASRQASLVGRTSG